MKLATASDLPRHPCEAGGPEVTRVVWGWQCLGRAGEGQGTSSPKRPSLYGFKLFHAPVTPGFHLSFFTREAGSSREMANLSREFPFSKNIYSALLTSPGRTAVHVWILRACRDVYPQTPCYSPKHSYIIRFVKKLSLEWTVHPFLPALCDGHLSPHASYHIPHLLPYCVPDPALTGS